MKVSVIVPNFNHAKYLRKRIDSILAQTFKDFELIILDDASTDNSREIILEYLNDNPLIVTCFNDQNSGSAFKQWNMGVSMARGEYIWIAESDDIADRHFLEYTVSELEKNEECGLVFCDSLIRDEEKGIQYRFSDKTKGIVSVKKLTTKHFLRNPIPNVSSVLFRKKAFVDSNPECIEKVFCGDWSLYMRILKKWEILYVNMPLSTFRLHNDSQYHKHYKTNKFLKEKLSICLYIAKASGYSPDIVFKLLTGLTISFLLRMMHIINLSPELIPEMPRRPGKVENING